jgi:hypothetical protein
VLLLCLLLRNILCVLLLLARRLCVLLCGVCLLPYRSVLLALLSCEAGQPLLLLLKGPTGHLRLT